MPSDFLLCYFNLTQNILSVYGDIDQSLYLKWLHHLK